MELNRENVILFIIDGEYGTDSNFDSGALAGEARLRSTMGK